MSILKNLRKKQQPKMDIRKAAQMISNVKKLIEMQLLHVDLSTRKFSLHTELFDGKDHKFKSNWCRAVALYWNVATGQDSSDEIFEVYNLDSGLQFGEFCFLKGDFRDLMADGGTVEGTFVYGSTYGKLLASSIEDDQETI